MPAPFRTGCRQCTHPGVWAYSRWARRVKRPRLRRPPRVGPRLRRDSPPSSRARVDIVPHPPPWCGRLPIGSGTWAALAPQPRRSAIRRQVSTFALSSFPAGAIEGNPRDGTHSMGNDRGLAASLLDSVPEPVLPDQIRTGQGLKTDGGTSCANEGLLRTPAPPIQPTNQRIACVRPSSPFLPGLRSASTRVQTALTDAACDRSRPASSVPQVS